MNWVVRAGATAAVSLCLALLLSALVSTERHAQEASVIVGFPGAPVYLTDANLVDYVSAIPLDSDIRRVRWNYSVLSMDLTSADGVALRAAIRDVAELARFSFDGTTNVKHMLVRFIRRDDLSGAETLLLAVNGTREQWEALGSLPEDQAEWKPLFDAFFAMKYTEAWRQ